MFIKGWTLTWCIVCNKSQVGTMRGTLELSLGRYSVVTLDHYTKMKKDLPPWVLNNILIPGCNEHLISG